GGAATGAAGGSGGAAATGGSGHAGGGPLDCSEVTLPQDCGGSVAYGDSVCPAQCTSCPTQSSRCEKVCDGSAPCSGETFVCPENLTCYVQCLSDDSCQNTTVVCPPTSACLIECANPGSCATLEQQCSALGPCYLNCSADSACNGASMQCGCNTCQATCDPSATAPTVNCGQACQCTPCST
ncbi:MAG: hypothetical protein JRI23_13505, partial [Deltaproteobacteria bacterium]|nr:hypothetical protein [Deltaproteobacteria bacterium]MBW2532744.1 hypothetical protein [Deltaproteobacteria bacterium]